MTNILLKAFGYRVFAGVFTVLAALLVTRNITISLGIGAVEFILKLLAYAAYEIFWMKVTEGEK